MAHKQYCSFGTNLLTAPANYDGYTSSDPSQTTVTSFQDAGADYLTGSNYWSSTEYNPTGSWPQSFDNGGQILSFGKSGTSLVRAVRRIQISQ